MDGKKEAKSSQLPHTRRLKSLRRCADIKDKDKSSRKDDIVLESVLGLTVNNTASLAISQSGVLAYPAGCVVVLLNIATKHQRHMINDDRKTVTCLAWSYDGQHLVTGESGHLPRVKVWSVSSLSVMASFSGHKFGVSNVNFTPNSHYIVSVGAEHDMTVNVWDWKANRKLASNKISFHVKSISISPDGSCFVAAGNRHLKFWYVDSGRMSVGGTVPLQGRSAIMGDKKNNHFLDVVFAKEKNESIFVITKSGLLCQLNYQRLLERWVELKVNSARCLCVGERFILVGCSEGVIRCFSVSNLTYICSLPKPDLTSVPDIVSMAYDELHSTLSVVYADHSLITWDVSDLSRVSILSSHNYHSACIWAVDTYQGDLTSGSTLVTCSNDDTIRIWSLDLGPLSNSSLECHLQKAIKIQNNEGQDSEKAGVKCVKVNSGENFIASGDRHGNIRVHNTTNYEEICKIEAHDAEIMSLQFAPGDKYLASGSRDRLIHLFDVENQFEFLTTVEEHSSCVTSVDFLSTGEDDFLVSSGADRSIISRKVVKDDGQVSVTRCQHIVCKTVPYDMVVGGSQPPNRIMVACQDRAVRSYPSDCPNSKPKLMKGSASDDGTLYKMTLDRSGSYYATSCSDKTIAVFNYQTGEMISTLVGHSDLVTGLVFSHDCQFLISVSGDSCIFVWRLPKKVSNTMASKLNMSTLTDDTQCCHEETKDEEFGSPSKIFDNVEESLSPDPSYRFSVGKLPIWARKKVLPDCQSSKSSSTSVQSPRGKWATKVVDNEDSEVNVLSRFEEQDDEPKIGSVEKTKKHLFCTDDDNEEFQVNAIDAETLRKSQKELSLPPSLETSASCQDDDDTNTSASFCDKPDCVLNINICEDDSSTEVSRKLTSISKAWREGTTPVQQRKQGVSIGKLLATNQLHALLQNVTPAKSPILSVNKEVTPRENSAKTLCHKPELSDVTFTQKLDAESDTMTRETIREAVSQVRETCDKLLTLYRRVSLDEDLDDNTRQELMTMMTEGSSTSQAKLRQISVSSGTCEDTRSKDEIASAAMENIRRFLSQNSKM